MLPLFQSHPELGEALPHLPLGEFPTPVGKLDAVGREIGLKSLYIKRDDLSGRVYGGNKVRKLEFLLANAVRRRAREVVTVGFAGSNHALATAIFARRLGLGSVSLLLSQVNAHYVRRNLLASKFHAAELHHFENAGCLLLGLAWRLLQGRWRRGAFPRLIPGGGSSPLGVVGYVNAAFELREQIAAGELPEPDLVYLPLGSMGTSVGLALGLKAAGLKSRVVPVRVVEEKLASQRRMGRLLRRTQAFARALDPTFPALRFSVSDLTTRDDCLGDGYAHFTDKGVSAAQRLRETEGIVLNGAYSAKAFSAIVDDAERRALGDKVVLFWNTYNSRDLSESAVCVDYRRLPAPFHRYFEQDVQPRDAAGLDR